MHNDEFFLQGYFRGLRLLRETSGLSVEVLIYSWESTKEFEFQLSKISEAFGAVKMYSGPDLGFGTANNRLASRASGRSLLILSPDTEILNTSTLLKEKLNSDNSVIGLCQTVGTQRTSYDPLRSTDIWFRARHTDRNTRHLYVDGAGFIINRDVFERLGGFDENIFLFLEDIDLCLRAKAQGIRLHSTNAINIWHYQGATVSGGGVAKENRIETSGNRQMFATESAIYLGLKWYPVPLFALWLLVFLMVMFAGIVLLTITGRGRLALGQLKGLRRGLLKAVTHRRECRDARRENPGVLKLLLTQGFKIPTQFRLLLKHGIPLQT